MAGLAFRGSLAEFAVPGRIALIRLLAPWLRRRALPWLGDSVFRRFLGTLMPARLRRAIWVSLEKPRLYSQFFIDARRYGNFCTPADWLAAAAKSERHRECQMTKDYHQVEKGLALSEPRRPFGLDLSQRLGALSASSAGEATSDYVLFAREALGALDDWNRIGSRNGELSPRYIDVVSSHGITPKQLGVFFESRHSVRDFDGVRPSVELLDQAVEIAGTTPSVCNRQAWRVHFYYGERAQELLSLQNGNRGFGEGVPCVAVVTVDARLFCGSLERNQRWIDGGLFAMTLVWAMHGLGLETCMLNWSRHEADSERLRKVGGIEEAWDVVVLIAVGSPRQGLRVTRSPKRALREISVHHDA